LTHPAPPDGGAPGAGGAQDAGELLERLRALWRWAGEPPAEALRSMAGTQYSGGGFVVEMLSPDALDRLIERGELPPWEQVEPFVAVCLRSRIASAEQVGLYLEQWRGGWRSVDAGELPGTARLVPSVPPRSIVERSVPPWFVAGRSAVAGWSGRLAGLGRARLGALAAAAGVLVLLVVLAIAMTRDTTPATQDRADPPTAAAPAPTGSTGAGATATASAAATAVAKPSARPRTGPVRIRPAATKLCLSEGSGSSGWLYQRACASQSPPMTLTASRDGTYQIHTSHPEYGPGCMGVDGGSKGPGAHVLDDYCASGHGQVFELEPVASPLPGYRLRPVHSNACLGVERDSVEPNAAVLQFPCNPTATGQVFLFVPR
jgi:hypothetical protein